MKINITFYLLLLLVLGNLKAQTPEEEGFNDFSYLLGDLSYSSDAVYMGRRDSIPAPYLYSSFGYYNRSGFFGNASASYLVSSGEERIDLYLFNAGYLFSKKYFSAGLSGTKYFFHENSYNVLSEIEAGITAMAGYNFKITELTLNAASYFSSNNSPDLAVSLTLDRNIYFLNKKLTINPAIILEAGTLNFYEEYYNTSRLGNRKGKDQGQQKPGTGSGGSGINNSEKTKIVISEASEFRLLNLEAQIPFQFFHKSFIFSFTPMIAFAQSGASIKTGNDVYKEDLESVFYWSAGISYWWTSR